MRCVFSQFRREVEVGVHFLLLLFGLMALKEDTPSGLALDACTYARIKNHLRLALCLTPKHLPLLPPPF